MAGLLQNHIAVVTGAGSGIGRAIALGFAREGASVAALDIKGDSAEKPPPRSRPPAARRSSFALDVTDRAACRAVGNPSRR